jgi:hypothetical protein
MRPGTQQYERVVAKAIVCKEVAGVQKQSSTRPQELLDAAEREPSSLGQSSAAVLTSVRRIDQRIETELLGVRKEGLGLTTPAFGSRNGAQFISGLIELRNEQHV